MNLFRSILMVMAIVAVGALAMAQKTVNPADSRPLTAADLEKAAAVPTIEQSILHAAADRLKQERKPVNTINLQLTATVSSLPPWCYEVCVGSGLNRACSHVCHSSR